MPRTRKHRPQIDTAAYERAHGRTPRGYGVWHFAPVDPITREPVARCISVTENYAAARLLARVRLDATLDGRAYDIEVLS